MTYEIIDSLVVNDSLHFVREDYFQQIIQLKEERYANLKKQNQIDLEIKNIEIDVLKKQKKSAFIKGVATGGGISMFLFLIFKSQ